MADGDPIVSIRERLLKERNALLDLSDQKSPAEYAASDPA